VKKAARQTARKATTFGGWPGFGSVYATFAVLAFDFVEAFDSLDFCHG